MYYWIDFTDIGTDGKWVTLSTGKSEYTSWISGQPINHKGKENCAVGMYQKKLWNDEKCDLKYQVMCEASGNFKVSFLFLKFNRIFTYVNLNYLFC